MPRELGKCRVWAKDRRDRLNDAFTKLCKVLPDYDPSKTINKIDILTKSEQYIQELQTKLQEAVDAKTSEKPERDLIKKLQDRVKKLLNRNEQLCLLIRDAGITVPAVYKPIKKAPYPWSGRIPSEKAKLLQKKHEKENLEKKRKTPAKTTAKNGQSTPKHRKVPSRNNIQRNVKVKRKIVPNVLLPPKNFIVVQQPIVSQSCYLITSAPSGNDIIRTTTSSTAMTNTPIIRNAVVSSTIKPVTSALNTNISLPALGPGTLIFPNGTAMPILPQISQIPQVITNPIPLAPPTNPTLIVIPKTTIPSTPAQTVVTSSVSNVKSTNQEVKVIQSKPKIVPRIKPLICSTTQINKVPIPALTSRYGDKFFSSKRGNTVVTVEKIVPEKGNVESKSGAENVAKQVKSKIITSRVIKKRDLIAKDSTKIVKKVKTSTPDVNNDSEKDAEGVDNSVNSICNEGASTSNFDKDGEKKSDCSEENKEPEIDKTDKDIGNTNTVNEEPVETKDTAKASEESANKPEISSIENSAEPVMQVSEHSEPNTTCENSSANIIEKTNETPEAVPVEREQNLNSESSKDLAENNLQDVDNIKENQVCENKIADEVQKIQDLQDKCDAIADDIKTLEMNLPHSELSNEIFASLQVPSGCQNPESTSPTAAFLLAFPLVSSLTGVKVTEVMDEDNTESRHGTPTLLQIGTMDTTKPTQSQSDSLTPSLLNLDNLSFFSSRDICNSFYPPFDHMPPVTSVGTTTSSVAVSSNSSIGTVKPVTSVCEVTYSEGKSILNHGSDICSSSQSSNNNGNNKINIIDNTTLALPENKYNLQSSMSSKDNMQNKQCYQEGSQLNLHMNSTSLSTSVTAPKDTLQNTSKNINNVLQNNINNTCENTNNNNNNNAMNNHGSVANNVQNIQNNGKTNNSVGNLGSHLVQNIQHNISYSRNDNMGNINDVKPLSTLRSDDLNLNLNMQQTFPQTKHKNNDPVHKIAESKSCMNYNQNMQQNKLYNNNQNNNFNCGNFQMDAAKISTTCVYNHVSKPYSDPLYTSSNTYSYGTENNQNYYKKPENRNYYNTSYDVYGDCKKNENNSSFSTQFSNQYYPHNQNYNKDKFPNPNNATSNNNVAAKSKAGNNQVRPPINWMTTPDNRQNNTEYAVPTFSKENDFISNSLYSTNSFISNNQTTYFNTNPIYSNSEIINEPRKPLDFPLVPVNNYPKNDTEENQFSWSPTKMSQLLEPPTYVSSGLNNILGDLRFKNNSKHSKSLRYDSLPQSNFLSVSQLVEHNKSDNPPGRVTSRRNSGNRSTPKNSHSKTNSKRNSNKNHDNKDDNTNYNSNKPVESSPPKNNPNQIKQYVGNVHGSDMFCNSSNSNNNNSNTNMSGNHNHGSSMNQGSKNRTTAKNIPSSYSAEALIGHQLQNDNLQHKSINNQQNFSSGHSKSLAVPPFLPENIISYFPPVDIPQENNFNQNQNYQSTSFSHNFPGSFQNNSYNNAYIPPVSTITTTYLPSNNFMHDVPTHDYITDNLNLFVNKDAKNFNKNMQKANLTADHREDKTVQNSSNCPNYKKTKRKHSAETTVPNFVDFPFLSVANAINSPILPDDFHAHSSFLPPPTPSQLYPCKAPLYPKQGGDLTTGSLLPLPPPVPVNKTSIQHPDISPSINTGGTSLTNFNLSTIFPEINKAPLNAYPESRNKDHVSRNYVSSSSQVSFNNKSTFSMSYINCPTSQYNH